MSRSSPRRTVRTLPSTRSGRTQPSSRRWRVEAPRSRLRASAGSSASRRSEASPCPRSAVTSASAPAAIEATSTPWACSSMPACTWLVARSLRVTKRRPRGLQHHRGERHPARRGRLHAEGRHRALLRGLANAGASRGHRDLDRSTLKRNGNGAEDVIEAPSVPPPPVAGPWRSYKEVVSQLASRIVEAQRPIRVLNAIRWDDGVEAQLTKSKYKELPKIDYGAIELGFDPREKATEFELIAKDIETSLGESDALGRIMIATALEYRDVVHMLASRGTPAFYAFSRKLYGSPKDTFPDGRATVRDLGHLLYDILTNVDDNLFVRPVLGDTSLHSQFDRTLRADEAVELLNARFAAYFADAQVRVHGVDDSIVADAAAGNDYVKVRSGALFSQRDIDILEVHEGWVHDAPRHSTASARPSRGGSRRVPRARPPSKRASRHSSSSSRFARTRGEHAGSTTGSSPSTRQPKTARASSTSSSGSAPKATTRKSASTPPVASSAAASSKAAPPSPRTPATARASSSTTRSSAHRHPAQPRRAHPVPLRRQGRPRGRPRPRPPRS